MPSINMIAPRRAEKKRVERDMRRLVLVIVAELVIAVGLGGWCFAKMLNTNRQIRALDYQITQLQPVVDQIKEYDTATQKLAPKLGLLNKAKDRTMRWYGTLDRLTQSLPSTTYLTRISTIQGGKNEAAVSMNLGGISISQARIGETMIRLHSIPDLQSVNLHFTQATAVDKVEALEFEIGAELKGNQPEKGAKANGSSQS